MVLSSIDVASSVGERGQGVKVGEYAGFFLKVQKSRCVSEPISINILNVSVSKLTAYKRHLHFFVLDKAWTIMHVEHRSDNHDSFQPA